MAVLARGAAQVTPRAGGGSVARRDVILAADPCGATNVRLVVGAARAGALGLLDLPLTRPLSAGAAGRLDSAGAAGAAGSDGAAVGASSGPDSASIVSPCGPMQAQAVTSQRIDVEGASAAIAEIVRRTDAPFAVRLPVAAGSATPVELPEQVEIVVVAGGVPAGETGGAGGTGTRPVADDIATLEAAVAAWPGRRVLVEVISRHEAAVAVAAGAAGVVAKGCESGGRIGDTESFVLAQQVAELEVPFWVQGGVGPRTAAAALAAGARGVVLDGQLALVRESLLDDEARAAVAAMDGSETRVAGSHRIYVRPDLPAAELADDVPAAVVAGRLGPDLRRDLLPLGQDATFAHRLAEQHVTTGGVVQAVRVAVDRQLTHTSRQRPLAPGRGVARAHRTRYPVVQGPMTRVSDRVDFAAAVADAGGLPFLALALLPGHEVRRLLTEAAEQLGDRPWGVGVLGFVPADVRAAQLEVIHDVRPPVALVAGGRPVQAQPLEDAGIATYLHVPSPGLLDRFLREGTRRFVFEGRECGGHVGPRASFPLWEAQVERLLDVDDAEHLDVLFAGGIHDARSAAMVACVAAPLAERGAGVGVLMGTAYLFTQEAVSCGAITPGFQEVACGCETTVLLETAPGHATRCVETDYVRAFAERKAELEASGCPPQDVWAELESLNLGRLRVASKGVRRQGQHLVELDETAQRQEGMYMIGQAATLRHEVTTLAELHEEVTTGATAHLDARVAEIEAATAHDGQRPGAGRPHGETSAGAPAARAPADRQAVRPRPPAATGAAGHRPGRPLDVAVVGMAGVFPGAADTEQYWANVLGGHDAVTEVPRDRWDPDRFYDPEAVTRDAGRRTPSRWGGFLPPVPFDALAYGIPPRSLASIESVQLLSLEVAHRALADAGYRRRGFDRSRVAVIFAAENGNDLGGAYGFRAAYRHYVGPLPPELDAHLPAPTEDSFPGVLTNVIAGRIANRLDLGGSNLTVDAACAASLAALDVACKELVGGTSDMVLCGAADVHNGINDYLLFASVHALSPRGRCRPFDAGADGIALGEGVACVVLKRLDDAERDGDRIYAVVEAVAGSSDGRHLGLAAPRQQGQVQALQRAYQRAGRGPASVGLIEAHGTGTVVGDRTELASLTEVLAADGAPTGSVVLGSVKSQIGHTKCAAGLAGIVKAARALHAGILPPTLHVETPNDFYAPDESPFRFLRQPAPWPSPQRRAGVSAFGFGGTNFHAVLRAHDDDRPAHGVAVWPAELFLVRAASSDAARDRLVRLQQIVEQVLGDDPDGARHPLRDLAWTVSSSHAGEPVRWAIVADDLPDLAAKLAQALAGTTSPGGVFRGGTIAGSTGSDGAGGEAPEVAFLHPGQGSQRPGMLADLFVAFPRLQAGLRGAERWVERMFPGAAFDAEQRAAQRAALTDTRAAQPALGLAAVAVTRLLRELGVQPDMAAGHSYGELVALWTAGALDERTLLTVSEARGEAMAAAAAHGPQPDIDASTTAGDSGETDAGTAPAAHGPHPGDDAGAAAGEGGEADAGAMAAVGLPADEVAHRLTGELVIANHNGPRQTVVAGPTPAVEALVEQLGADGVGAQRLEVAAAFHSPLVASVGHELAARLEHVRIGEPVLPTWSGSTAAPYPSDPAAVRATLVAQVAQPVRFVEQIEAMYAAGARVFVEAGPGRVLTQLVGKILGDRPHRAVACDVAGEPALRRLLLALAELAAVGVPVDVRPLFRGRAERVDLGALPLAAPGWRVNGHLVCTSDGEPVPGGLQPADRIPEVVVNDGHPRAHQNGDPSARLPGDSLPTGVPPAPGPREEALLEYLRSLQQVVDAQREVMLAYLGETGADVTPAAGLAALRPALDLPGSLGGTGADRPRLDRRGDAGRSIVGRAERHALNGNGVGTSGVQGNGHRPSGTETALAGTTAPGATDPSPATSFPSAAAGPPATPPTSAAAPAPPPAPAHPPASPAPAGSPSIHPASREPSAAESSTGTPPRRPRGDELLAIVLDIVAERTGYPLEMLDPDLDLEADLSIDSIKRMEIIGELADRVGLPGADPGAAAALGVDQSVVEQLAQRKPLRAIVAWIDELQCQESLRDEAGATATATATATAGDEPGSRPPAPVPDTVRRFVLETAMLAPALPVASAAGKRLVLVSDPWDGLDELRGRLERAGATVEILPTHRGAPGTPLPEQAAVALAQADGVVHLGAADRRAPVDARDVFTMLRPAAAGSASILVAAVGPMVPTSPTAVSGVPGLMRALARELPDRHVRAVELSADQSPPVVARLLADEILDPAGPVSVAYRDGTRITRRVAKGAPLDTDVPTLPFDAGSVVVMTGGARGITARAALAVAQATGCRLELLGRSPVPADQEDPRTADASDREALRRTLVELGDLRTPAHVEAACHQILTAREIRATLDALRQRGCAVTYHSVDVRDRDALHRVLDDVRRRHGRIDAIVHGAGVLDDRLARDKTDDDFDRVFATKVDAARTLLGQLQRDVRLLVFFGSVSGVFGNRGQVDYGAANDALDELAGRLDGVGGRRIVSIDWGPWSDTGMVSPELERGYARRGIGLVDPEAGVRALLAEMATLPGEPAQVVVMRAEPEAFVDGHGREPVTWPAAPTTRPDRSRARRDPSSGLTLEDLTESE